MNFLAIFCELKAVSSLKCWALANILQIHYAGEFMKQVCYTCIKFLFVCVGCALNTNMMVSVGAELVLCWCLWAVCDTA